MMIKYSIQIGLMLALVFAVSSCENEPLEGDFPANENPDPTNPNPEVPGPPTAPGEGSTGDYWPTAVGNIWLFTTLNGDGSTNENEYEILSETTFDGVAAFELNEFFLDSQLGYDDNDAGDFDFDFPGEFDFEFPDAPEIVSTNYIIKNDGNYGFYNPGLDVEFQGLQTTISPFGYVFLKDYLEEGESYSGTFTITVTNSFDFEEFAGDLGEFGDIDFSDFEIDDTVSSYDADYEITVVQRDFEMTVNDVAYENVMHVNYQFTIGVTDEELDFSETIISESDVYFAKDIGPIKIVSDSEEQSFDSEIISYELN